MGSGGHDAGPCEHAIPMEAPPREDVASNVPHPTADADLLCPLCEYDLRGQTEPRKTESGKSLTPVPITPCPGSATFTSTG